MERNNVIPSFCVAFWRRLIRVVFDACKNTEAIALDMLDVLEREKAKLVFQLKFGGR